MSNIRKPLSVTRRRVIFTLPVAAATLAATPLFAGNLNPTSVEEPGKAAASMPFVMSF